MINFSKIKTLVVVAAVAITGLAASAIGTSSETVNAASCTNGSSYNDFNGSYTRNSLTVWTKNNKKLCKDVKVNFTTFEVLNKNYNGKGFSKNPTALPQSSIFNKTVTLKKGTNGKTTVQVAVPDACTPYQIDAYLGRVQSKITTGEGLVNTRAIVGKLFQRTKTDCTVKVCDPATGEIITVHESKQNDYKPIGDIACKPPVEVCDPATGKTITVKASEADKYKQVGDDACKPAPEKAQVCNPKTGETITVDKDKTDQYKPVGDEACKNVKVCDPATGKTITVKASEAGSYYKDVDDAACDEAPVVTELPETGPADSFVSMLGATVLAGTATAFLRSRQ